MSSSKFRARSIFSLTCGCKDSKSVSLPILISDSSDKSTATTKTASTAKSLAVASTPSFSSIYEEDQDASSTPSFSGLLRQLRELERKVIEWAPPANEKEAAQALQQQQEQHHKVEESVAVVKESEDPLTDFRKSMLQMIVEKEILNGGELRELLSMFLQINSRRHHEVIVQAFAEIWKEVFAGYEDAPELFTRSN